MIKCPYCNKSFKRLTANHMKTHGITWENYIKDFKEENYIDLKIVEFLNNFYITKRSKYLIYNYKCANPITVYAKKDGNMPLHMGILKQHRSHRKTVGIFFSELGSKIIGLDLDSNNIELLNKIYKKLLEFLPETCILITFSGKKGYHIDVFLEDIVPRDIIKRFYKVLLNQINTDEKTLELRGASAQGYKLPFSIHQGTQQYCYACTHLGEEIEDKYIVKLLETRTKANIRQLESIIELEYNIEGLTSSGLDNKEIIEFEEIKDSVTLLSNYSNLQEDFIENLSKVYREGFSGEGIRNKYTFKIALFLKCHMLCKREETLKEMKNWANKCKGYKATKKEFLRDIESTVNRIYKEDLKLTVAAKEIRISKVEIKEILSIKTKNKLQTKALRKLYYMFLLQSKAYSDVDGVFYFTLEQMQHMGAVKKKDSLMEQIKILIDLGKVYKYATKRVSRIRYAPTEYRLIALGDVVVDTTNRTFNVCETKECNSCLECATCFFIKNNKELKTFFTARKKECPYNK